MQVQSIIVPQQSSDAPCSGYGLFVDYVRLAATRSSRKGMKPCPYSITTSIRQELMLQRIIVWQDEDKNWKVLCGWYVWNKRESFRPKCRSRRTCISTLQLHVAMDIKIAATSRLVRKSWKRPNLARVPRLNKWLKNSEEAMDGWIF